MLWVYFTPLRLAVATVLLGLAAWLALSESGGEEEGLGFCLHLAGDAGLHVTGYQVSYMGLSAMRKACVQSMAGKKPRPGGGKIASGGTKRRRDVYRYAGTGAFR